MVRLVVGHVHHLFPGPQELFRLTMAVQAPLHLQGVFLVHERHLVYRPMAAIATHTLVYVNAVVEIYKIRKVVDARPLDGLAAAEAEPHRLQHGCVSPDQSMTVHARLGRWDPGKAGIFDRRVAVTAVESQPGDVMLVAERDWLFRRDVLPGHIRRALQLEQRCSDRRKKKNDAKNTRTSKRICAAVKNLCHERCCSQEPSCSNSIRTRAAAPSGSSAMN